MKSLKIISAAGGCGVKLKEHNYFEIVLGKQEINITNYFILVSFLTKFFMP